MSAVYSNPTSVHLHWLWVSLSRCLVIAPSSAYVLRGFLVAPPFWSQGTKSVFGVDGTFIYDFTAETY